MSGLGMQTKPKLGYERVYPCRILSLNCIRSSMKF